MTKIEKAFVPDMTDAEPVAALTKLQGIDEWLHANPAPERAESPAEEEAERLNLIGLANRYKAMEALCKILHKQRARQPYPPLWER
jgi:hypothetical protein